MTNLLPPLPALSAMKQELRSAVKDLTDRRLHHAAKFAAELLVSTKNTSQDLSETPEISKKRKKTNIKQKSDSDIQSNENDLISLAQIYFDVKEYQRSAYLLLTCKSSLAIFLRCYSTFLAGEKHKEEDNLEHNDHNTTTRVENKELLNLYTELNDLHSTHQTDGFFSYLLGVILKELGRLSEARQVLLESVQFFPCNWSAWLALSDCCPDHATLDKLGSNTHWMYRLFLVEAYQRFDKEEGSEGLNILKQFEDHLPQRCTQLVSQHAVVLCNIREYDEALRQFEELKEFDPFKLDNMDLYSHILYLTESFGALSYLAHTSVKIDKYRPETCCIIGNYYSLKREHEKAALYFKRALKLNPKFLSAWTLLGHEFIEMHNCNAAIWAYRKAVDIDPKDFRAWYGLGQAYEILQMHMYSIYYFSKAVALRPFDSRMWCAVAESYDCLGQTENAIKCYLKAETNNDHECIALDKLARLYLKIGDRDTCAFYFRKVLTKMEGENIEPHNDALLFLAQYCKDCSQFDEAEKYCTLLFNQAAVREQAKALFREVRSLRPQ